MLPVFEAVERHIINRFPNTHWLSTTISPQQQQQPSSASGKVLMTCPLSPAASADTNTVGHMTSLASHMSDLTRSLSSVVLGVQQQHQHEGTTARSETSHSRTQSATRPAGSSHTLQDGCSVSTSSTLHADCVVAPEQWPTQGSYAKQPSAAGMVSVPDEAKAAAAAETVGPRHHATAMLMFVNRTVITGLMLFVACALPFFSSIMGFFGECCCAVVPDKIRI